MFVSFFLSSTDVCCSFRGHHSSPESPSYDVQAHNTSSMTTAPASLSKSSVKYSSEQQEEKQPADMQRRNDFTEANYFIQSSSLAKSFRADSTGIRIKHPFDLRFPLVSRDDYKGPCLENIIPSRQASLRLESSAMCMFSPSLTAVDA